MVKRCILIRSDIAKRFLDVDRIKQLGFDVRLGGGLDGVDYVIAGKEVYDDDVLKDTSVKVISRCGHGTDNIRMNGVKILDCRGVLDLVVAEAVLGYMLMAVRRLHEYDNRCRRGDWSVVFGRSLSGMTVGLIGFGGIGRMVARLLEPFDVELLHFDIKRDRCNCSLDHLLERSDIISLHCDLNESSRGLIGEREVLRMRDGVIFINTSRGGVVDSSVLLRHHRRFGCIVLDVFDVEPLPLADALFGCDNVVLGVHSAGYTEAGHRCLAERCLENVVLWDKLNKKNYVKEK